MQQYPYEPANHAETTSYVTWDENSGTHVYQNGPGNAQPPAITPSPLSSYDGPQGHAYDGYGASQGYYDVTQGNAYDAPQGHAYNTSQGQAYDIQGQTYDTQGQTYDTKHMGNEVLVQATTDTRSLDHGALARRPTSPISLWGLFLDLVLTAPPILFLVYAGLLCKHRGSPISQDPVPSLREASIYGPTVFPIAFAAVAGNFLKAFAAWKLERGISVLSLHSLLRSHSVFSAYATPLYLFTVNAMTPVIMLLWALSPLGGQAALRVVETAPSNASQAWNYSYLDFEGQLPHSGPESSAGMSLLPSIVGTFSTLLTSPHATKVSTQDIFGNVKIPLVEAYREAKNLSLGYDWYTVGNETDLKYSSMAGIPVLAADGQGFRGNTSFDLETSYMYANCTMRHVQPKSFKWWTNYKNSLPGSNLARRYTNGRNLVVDYQSQVTDINSTAVLTYTSIDEYWDPIDHPGSNETAVKYGLTNATCHLSTSYVKAAVACHESDCRVERMRSMYKPTNETIITVIDGVKLFRPYDPFLETFINSTDTVWSDLSAYKLAVTPLEAFFVDPDTPYQSDTVLSNEAPDYAALGDAVFSRRMTQLLNTFWLASIAPNSVSGNIDFSNSTSTTGSSLSKRSLSALAVSSTGTLTPDVTVLRVNGAWLGVLLAATAAMLGAAVGSAAFGVIRRGPDLLEYEIGLLRNSPYLNIGTASASSMEGGSEQTRRLKDVRVCLGDITPGEENGYVAIATVDGAVPISQQDANRTYR